MRTYWKLNMDKQKKFQIQESLWGIINNVISVPYCKIIRRSCDLSILVRTPIKVYGD